MTYPLISAYGAGPLTQSPPSFATMFVTVPQSGQMVLQKKKT